MFKLRAFLKSMMLNSVLLATLFGDSVAQAQFTFTKIADFNTPIPGGSGTFTAFGGFAPVPALRDGRVAFVGDGASGQRGSYVAEIGGALTRLADTNTPNPRGPGNLTDFGPLTTSRGVEYQRVFGSSGYQGIYTFNNNSMTLIADTNTPIPGGIGNFASTSAFYSFDGLHTAFCGVNSVGQVGVYTNLNGTLSVVADANTPIPGRSETFTNIPAIGTEDILGRSIAFVGFGPSGYGGIFSTDGGIHPLVDTNTPVPGGIGNFANFGALSLDLTGVAFKALDSLGRPGIFSTVGGLHTVADTSTPIPGGTGTFAGFGFSLNTGPSLSDENVAFLGTNSDGQEGLYIAINGTLNKIVAPGDVLDGKTVLSILTSTDGLDGNLVGLEAFFTDGTRGIFVAKTVPEPSSLIILSTGLILLFGSRLVHARSSQPASVGFSRRSGHGQR